uniref:Uncharacterized protein n=1 Tax=Romanomermis culicivorax TaxID=13658 RepID=A0A915IJG2_ROMCU
MNVHYSELAQQARGSGSTNIPLKEGTLSRTPTPRVFPSKISISNIGCKCQTQSNSIKEHAVKARTFIDIIGGSVASTYPLRIFAIWVNIGVAKIQLLLKRSMMLIFIL